MLFECLITHRIYCNHPSPQLQSHSAYNSVKYPYAKVTFLRRSFSVTCQRKTTPSLDDESVGVRLGRYYGWCTEAFGKMPSDIPFGSGDAVIEEEIALSLDLKFDVILVIGLFV